jgi:hypothetical protein
MPDTQKVAPLPLRLPEELKLWLRAQALANHRSMTGEVIKRIEESRARQLKGAKS